MFPIAAEVYEPPRIEEVRPIESHTFMSPLFEQLQLQHNRWGGQCVKFVNEVLGTKIAGNAWDWKPTTSVPIVGGIVIFKNHVAIVVGVIGDAIILAESNWSRNDDEKIDIGRTVLITDPSIKGYIPPWTAVAMR